MKKMDWVKEYCIEKVLETVVRWQVGTIIYPLILSIESFLGEEPPGFSPRGSSTRCEEESQGWGEYAGGAVDLTGE